MKTGMVLVLIAMASTATAQDLNFGNYKKFLMQGNNGSGKKMAIQTNCTNSEGVTYRIGEKGYDACFNALKQKKNSPTTTPEGQ